MVLVDGFLLAMEETNKVLAAAAMRVTNSDDEALVSIAKTAMTGTSSESNSDELAEMIVAAAKNTGKYTNQNSGALIHSELEWLKAGLVVFLIPNLSTAW